MSHAGRKGRRGLSAGASFVSSETLLADDALEGEAALLEGEERLRIVDQERSAGERRSSRRAQDAEARERREGDERELQSVSHETIQRLARARDK